MNHDRYVREALGAIWMCCGCIVVLLTLGVILLAVKL